MNSFIKLESLSFHLFTQDVTFCHTCGPRWCSVHGVSTLAASLICPLEPSVGLGSTHLEAWVAIPPQRSHHSLRAHYRRDSQCSANSGWHSKQTWNKVPDGDMNIQEDWLKKTSKYHHYLICLKQNRKCKHAHRSSTSPLWWFSAHPKTWLLLKFILQRFRKKKILLT